MFKFLLFFVGSYLILRFFVRRGVKIMLHRQFENFESFNSPPNKRKEGEIRIKKSPTPPQKSASAGDYTPFEEIK